MAADTVSDRSPGSPCARSHFGDITRPHRKDAKTAAGPRYSPVMGHTYSHHAHSLAIAAAEDVEGEGR